MKKITLLMLVLFVLGVVFGFFKDDILDRLPD